MGDPARIRSIILLERLQGQSVDDLLEPVQERARPTGSVFDTLQVGAPDPLGVHAPRLREFEAMLKNPKSDYYEGANSKALRQEYFQLLGGEPASSEPKLQIGNVQPDTPAQSSGGTEE